MRAYNQLLRAAWEDQGMPSMRKVGREIGVAHSSVHQLLTGSYDRSSWATVEKVGNYFNVDPVMLRKTWLEDNKAALNERRERRLMETRGLKVAPEQIDGLVAALNRLSDVLERVVEGGGLGVSE